MLFQLCLQKAALYRGALQELTVFKKYSIRNSIFKRNIATNVLLHVFVKECVCDIQNIQIKMFILLFLQRDNFTYHVYFSSTYRASRPTVEQTSGTLITSCHMGNSAMSNRTISRT